MNAAIFTICSRNYLGQAITLMLSAREHEPTVDRYIVLVDRKVDDAQVDQDIASIIWLDELEIPDVEYKALIFDVLELNTNVKPTVLRRLLRRYERCVYLDPDTILYAPLAPVWEALRDANVVATPHLVEPPTPRAFPWEQELLRHGSLNLGFIGVSASAESDRMLRWWEDRCLTCGFNAPNDGFFVDQKLMDHAHTYFDGVKVLRHRGLNIAYWNLHERPLRRVGDRWFVGEELLIFMHFSGFDFSPDATQAHKVSRYPTTVSLESMPQIRPLFDDYRSQLGMNRYREYAATAYSFAAFDNGVPLNRIARRLLGTGALQVADRDRPFRSDGPVYQALAAAGALPGASSASTAAPRNRTAEQESLRKARSALRWLFRVLGVRRYESLLKFMAHSSSTLGQGFLTRR